MISNRPKVLVSYLVAFFTCLLVSRAFAQRGIDTTDLAVTGVARVTVAPDIGVLSIDVSEVRLTMSGAVEALATKAESYVTTLTEQGYAEGDIKTTSFGVSTNQIRRDGDDIDSGYVARQKVRLVYDYSPDRLSQLFQALGAADYNVEFGFTFELSDSLKQQVRDKILVDAIQDAQAKAETMAEAASLKLVGLASLTDQAYEFSDMQQVSRESNYYGVAADAVIDSSYDLQPDGILFQKAVILNFVAVAESK